MKINLLATKYLKGLDIDLKLNNPSSSKINQIVKKISSNLSNYSQELGLLINPRTDRDSDRAIFIPDEANIERIDITDWKDRKQISNKIRLDSSENVYVLMSQDDELKYLIIDNVILEDQNTAIPTAVGKASYILVIKREDLLKSKAKREERVSNEKLSIELEKTKEKERKFKRLRNLYSMFSKEVEKYRDMVQSTQPTVDEEDDDDKLPINLQEGKLYDVKKNQYFFATQFPKKDTVVYLITDDFSNFTMVDNDPNIRRIKYKTLNWKNGDIQEEQQGPVDGGQTVYFWDGSFSTKDKPEKDFEIEDFVPEIDLKQLLKKDDTFPSNLFPTYSKTTFSKQVDKIKDYWGQLVKVMKELKVTSSNIDSVLEKYETSVREGVRTSRNMEYTDKSGYKVDLGKYFDKAASIPPQVPNSVKEAYNSVFNYLTEKTKILVEKIKELAEKEEFTNVSQIAYILKEKGTKQFNKNFEKKVSNPEVWSRGSSDYIKPQKIINHINDFKAEFEESILDINSIL